MIAAIAGVAAIAAYLYGVRSYDARFPDRAFSVWRIAAFICGCLLMTVVLLAPIEPLADRSFAWHMTQHVALMLVGPPLVLLGAPLLLLVAATPQRTAQRITGFAQSRAGRALFAPLTGWVLFIAVLWTSHFSPLYEAALENPAIHVAEHALYVFAATLFWASIVQVGYTPRPLPYPARMLYLFLAIPQGAFLGLALYAARQVLYPHYLRGHSVALALADQQNGGAVMWIAGGFLLFVAFMCTAGAWAAAERAPA
ncbi:MAG TPA: cytochrome c oxidase assembly protein [Candidatus Baltobacteraceae bacterium]|nr:cytochrome c oxidase assembly protein [Candidatus Baltobacteraceae bacterium]